MATNHDRLGLGHGTRTIPVTVTTTALSLATLISTADANRTEMVNRRVLRVHNVSGVTIFLLETSGQTVANGWQLLAGEKEGYEASNTFTDNSETVSDTAGAGLLFAVASGTATMNVQETS